MQETWSLIQHVTTTITTSGKYGALYLAALFFLFLHGRDKKKERILCYYGVLSYILVMNPVTAGFMIKEVPAFSDYWKLLWLMPMDIIIAYFGMSFISSGKRGSGNEHDLDSKNTKWKMGYAVVAVIVIALSGTVVPFQADISKAENDYGITNESLEALQIVTENQTEAPICLLAPDAVMEEARVYSGAITLVYGRDIWNETVNMQVADGYDEMQMALHQAMGHHEDCMDAIIPAAVNYGCNTLIVNGTLKNEPIFDKQDFQLVGTTDSYAVYMK